MLRLEVRHNGFTRPCSQMRTKISPADSRDTARLSVAAAAASALGCPFDARAAIYTPTGAEANALRLHIDVG